MGINSISYSGSLFGQAVLNLNNQLTNLSTELATGEKSTTYAGMGVNEGFAVAARAQLSNISAFGDTITNVNTIIGAANTALQSLTSIATTVQGDASTTSQDINSSGQTIGQQNAQSQLVSMIGILNTQVGNRYIFSGSAINTPAVASSDAILNGSGTQAGLKQLIAERAIADGTTGLGRLVISSPSTTGTAPATTTSFSVSEDTAGSPFGLKLSSVSSTTTAGSASTSPSVSGPSGSPASVSFSFGSTNPSPGDQVTLNFNLPDGTTSAVTLTASSSNPPPSGSYLIGSTPAATAANLNSAVNTAIGTLANTTLVAASAVAAGNDFFDPSSSATGAVADSKAGTPITTSTTLSGSGNALSSGFADKDTLTVDGTTITFSSSAATNTSGSPYVINTGGTVGNLLSAIDSITGATTPSSIDGGAVTLNTPNAASFSISTTSSGVQSALAALGFSTSAGTATSTTSGGTTTTTISAVQPPLRVSSAGSVTGAAATNQQTTPQAITGATALSGAAGSDSLSAAFQNNDSITVDGTTISFSSSATTNTSGSPYVINTASGKVSDLLSAINSITGGTSSIDANGAITINTPNAASFSITTLASDPTAQAALGALGFSQAAGTATNTGGSGSVTGAAELDQQTSAQPIATSTALSGTAPSASLTAGFADGDSITVDGTTINFSTSAPQSLTGPTYSINPTTGTVGNLLSAIDSITGTTTPSSISAGGAVSINTPSVASFSITASSSDPTAQAALAALGFSPGSTTIAATGGTNITANATSLVNGSADTVAWYTGNNSPDPRASSTALVDSGISAEYGMQANEQAIRQQLEGIAVYAAMTESPTAANSAGQANALSSRIATNMTSQPGQQQISDIQTDLANAQTTMQAASARQTQTQTMLQNMVDSTETVSTEQVASEILAIQSSLSASYQTTSILSKLTLTNFLAPGA